MTPPNSNSNFPSAERVAAALMSWRNVWQKTPVAYWNVPTLWQTLNDEAETYRLLAESEERAFCRGALEELAFEIKKRLPKIDDVELRRQLNRLAEVAASRSGSPSLEELRCLLGLNNVESCGGSFSTIVGPLPKSQALPLQVGDVVTLSDDYEVQKIAGTGGQKAVYMVVSKRLGQRFAVKELNPRLGGSQSLRQAVEREAKLQAKLQHQGIPKIFTLRSDADPASQTLPQFVESYIDGKTWQDERSFDRARFEKNLETLTQVANIMAYAHQKGVVHRDLKPENIMIGEYGETYVVDFGLAFDLAEEGPQSGASGTYQYIAPEQVADEPVDEKADVFSLGAILYRIIYGFAPYEIAFNIQGSGCAARKALTCDFAPLEPEAAKAELLRLAEEALTSLDASAELRALAEKAVLAVASPFEIWTFAKKKLLEVDAVNILDENVAEFLSPLDGVANFQPSPFIDGFANDRLRRRAVADFASSLQKIARSRPRDAVEELRRLAVETLFSASPSDALRRFAETALVASTSITPKLREILQKALARDPAERFSNAKEFADALETYRPQHESLERLAKLTTRFNEIKLILDAQAFDDLPEVCASYFEQGVQISSEFYELRRTTQNFAALQTVYREELTLRRYLIDKGLELQSSDATKRLIDLQFQTLERYSYDADVDDTHASFSTSTKAQAARLAIYAKENQTPVKTLVTLTLCSALMFYFLGAAIPFVMLLFAAFFFAFSCSGGADLIALDLDSRKNRVFLAQNEPNKRSA